ncbi:MRT, a raffinose family of oligosaccharides transporter [Metarhizium album ARSEF 1941]|uniref:MRT, a raffinose family of oligosaccharides transporter n=1 Tax=Metarhizium album (strain ARSEF 1941) TaxID=1081103 RepID=A0A0B2WW83_METAS|nr:MRT, a raffinose family of oligosaccharides transporter [Metarhizium album ARSEF 1941]KHO00457.1 MRT, a raffinose family of oligosaccharides transporter [Metarhizium album ARSEF 1941]
MGLPIQHHDKDQPCKVSVDNGNMDNDLAHEAATAAEQEQNMGLLKSLKLYRKACLWSIFLSTCIVMEGFDTVLLNTLFAYPPFQEKFGEEQPDGTYQLTAAWQAGLSNGTLVGQIFGLFVNGIIADRFGYRKTLIGALVGCAGCLFIVFFAESLTQLLIGQILIGVPWGVFQTLTTTYASEVCPTHLRAYLTTYVNLCWVIGQFIASGVLRGMISRDDKWGYKIPFALQWMWPIPLIIGIYLAPESPWWLVRRNRIDDAKKSLARLTARNSGVGFQPDETISMMIHTNEMEKELTAGISYADLVRGKVNRRRTEIVCVTWMIQTLCGSTFMGYSTYFYQQAGMAVANSFSMSLGQYALGAVGTVCSWFLMGRWGRRTLYLSGQIIMCILLLAIGCTAFAGKENPAAQWAIGSMLLVYTFTYDATVGPVCYSLVAELTSTRLRTKSVVLARNCYNIAGIVTNIMTPRMLNPSAWNWGAKAGFFWTVTCLACAIWTYFRLPEPKGRTYGELDVLFENGISAREFSSTPVDRLGVRREGTSEKDTVSEVMVERVRSHRS